MSKSTFEAGRDGARQQGSGDGCLPVVGLVVVFGLYFFGRWMGWLS